MMLLIPRAQSLTLGVDESGYFWVPQGANQIDGRLNAEAIRTNRDHDVQGTEDDNTGSPEIACALYGSTIDQTGWYYDADSSPADPNEKFFCECWDEGAQQDVWDNISFTVVSPN